MTDPSLTALHAQDVAVLRSAIAKFAVEHEKRPFGALREIGVQAALKRITDAELGSASTVLASVIDFRRRPVFDLSGMPLVIDTDRVRLESKVQLPGTRQGSVKDEEREGGAAVKQQERSDLILYKRVGVEVVRYRNGPGDFVHRSYAASVLAALEIKADPSHSANQRRGYGRDIERLLRQREAGIEGFFVILDKSSPGYGYIERRDPLVGIDWEPCPGDSTPLDKILRGRSKSRADYSTWADILICRVQPPQPYIEIHDVTPRVGAATADKRRPLYAYRRI